MQAVLITAYHNFTQLSRLSEILSSRFEVYIHVDKKAKKAVVPVNDRVHVYSVYNVNWGSCNHLRSILLLMQEALKNDDNTYFHLISGDDWPTRDIDDIYNHFEDNNEIDIMCTKFSSMTKEWYDNCHIWQRYYWWMDCFDYKIIPIKVLVKSIVLFQRLFGVNRLKKLPMIIGSDRELAQGLVWGSYPRDSIQYCLDYNKSNPLLLEFLSSGNAAEEFFFHTILSNDERFSARITGNNYRYMNWSRKNGSYPAVLDINDFESIEKSECFFCRKVHEKVSAELIEALNSRRVKTD